MVYSDAHELTLFQVVKLITTPKMPTDTSISYNSKAQAVSNFNMKGLEILGWHLL